MDTTEWGLQPPSDLVQARRQPTDELSVDEQQARQLVFMAFRWLNTGYDRWLCDWRQKTGDGRLEPHLAKLEKFPDGYAIVISDGIRTTRVPIPNNTKRLFDLVLAVPLNRAIIVLDRTDPIVNELASKYLKGNPNV